MREYKLFPNANNPTSTKDYQKLSVFLNDYSSGNTPDRLPQPMMVMEYPDGSGRFDQLSETNLNQQYSIFSENVQKTNYSDWINPSDHQLVNWICQGFKISQDRLISMWKKYQVFNQSGNSPLFKSLQNTFYFQSFLIENRTDHEMIPEFSGRNIESIPIMKTIQILSSCIVCHISCDCIYHSLIKGVSSMSTDQSDSSDLKCCRCKYGASRILRLPTIACRECLQRTPGIAPDMPSFM